MTRMLIHQVIHEDPPSPRKLNSLIPRDLETITLKCLEKEPAKRYDNCDLLTTDLQSWLDHEPIKARPLGRVGRLARWCKRKPAMAGLSAAVLRVLMAGTPISTYFALDASRKARLAREQRTLARESEAQGTQALGMAESAENRARKSESEAINKAIQAGGLIRDVAFTPDGNCVASAIEGGGIRISSWDVQPLAKGKGQ